MSQCPATSRPMPLWLQQLEDAAARGAPGKASNGCSDGDCPCHPKGEHAEHTWPSIVGFVLSLAVAMFRRGGR